MAGKRSLRVAVAQLRVDADDMELNACGILEALDLAAGEGADFLVTPETALTGYHGRFDKPRRDRLVRLIRDACRGCGVSLILGAGDKRGGRTYNEQLVIGGDGRIVGRHVKMALTDGDRKWFAAGTTLRVFRRPGLTFGCLICNDLWVTPGCGAQVDPRRTLKLSRRGARVIFHSVFSGHQPKYVPFHESNLALRAAEGRLFIAVANAVAAPAVNCSSGIMGPDGQWAIRCNRRGRQFAVANIRLSPQRSQRPRRKREAGD